MMKRLLHNQRGAMTIVLLMMLGSLFVIMMGIAGVKLMNAAKKSSETNEAYNYLIVMEEMGVAITRARSLGRDLDCGIIAACPAGTQPSVNNTVGPTTICSDNTNRNRYSLCVPDTDIDGTAEASDFCVTIDALDYCLHTLAGLVRADLTDENELLARPPAYVAVAGAAQEQTNGTVPVPRNNAETWSPAAVGWGFDNQIRTSDCSAGVGASEYWLGCNNCADPRIECWQIGMCRPTTETAGVPVTFDCTSGGADPGALARQGLMMYFENNRR